LIVYDNACHLHAYCLNRDPIRYAETSFRIDRFHWKNHTACNKGYQLRLYDPINSEIVEQKNAVLKKLRSQLSYMSVQNFLAHTAVFLAHQNFLEKKKSQ